MKLVKSDWKSKSDVVVIVRPVVSLEDELFVNFIPVLIEPDLDLILVKVKLKSDVVARSDDLVVVKELLESLKLSVSEVEKALVLILPDVL